MNVHNTSKININLGYSMVGSILLHVNLSTSIYSSSSRVTKNTHHILGDAIGSSRIPTSKSSIHDRINTRLVFFEGRSEPACI
jgi:hypothetical protein